MFMMLSHPITAGEEVSLDFLEFLGGMVEADDEYITPMELYEYENLSSEGEVDRPVTEQASEKVDEVKQ